LPQGQCLNQPGMATEAVTELNVLARGITLFLRENIDKIAIFLIQNFKFLPRQVPCLPSYGAEGCFVYGIFSSMLQ